MGDVQGITGNPGVGLVSLIIIGGLAGWIAGMITDPGTVFFDQYPGWHRRAFVGSKLAEVLQIPTFGFWRLLIAATVGAIVILFVWRRVHPQ